MTIITNDSKAAEHNYSMTMTMVYGNHTLLVGGIPTPLKNMKVNGVGIVQYMMEHHPAMFGTTNQYWCLGNGWEWGLLG